MSRAEVDWGSRVQGHVEAVQDASSHRYECSGVCAAGESSQACWGERKLMFSDRRTASMVRFAAACTWTMN